jgi:hypothetical protein
MSQRFLDFLARPEFWATSAALVGFLTLTWAIRGAPIGQAGRAEPDEAPASGYRDRVVALAVVGFLLVLAGAYLALAVGIPWSIPAFAVGFGIVLMVLRTNRRYRHASPTLRRALEFSNTALTASLVGGILIVGNVVAFKYGGRAIDLTRDRSFSLSSRTLGLLRSLDRPVTFTAFFGESENSARQAARVHQLLALYKAANPSKISVETLDPYRDAKEYEELVKRVPDMIATPGDGVVIVYGEGEGAPHTVTPARAMFEGMGTRLGPDGDRFVTTFHGEDALTSALNRLSQGDRSRVAFTTGHGEPSTAELDPSRPGLGLWRARLSLSGIDAVDVNLIREDVPDDVSLLVICAPRTPFQADELERLRQFVIRKGQLIVLVGNGEPSGLDEFLRNYNVEVGQGRLAVDRRFYERGRPTRVYVPIVPGGRPHPIVESLAGYMVLAPDSAPLNALGGPPKAGDPPMARPANPGVSALPFLKTSPDSWAESSPRGQGIKLDPDKDIAGPVTVGLAVSILPATADEKPTPRMVVLSSPQLADNQTVRQVPANLDLLMNAIVWLRGRPDLMGIDPSTHESLPFTADQGMRQRLVMVPTLLALVAILGLGASTYLARRD